MNKKEQLIEEIMFDIKNITETKAEDEAIRKVLKKHLLPEDNEWDVVEIKHKDNIWQDELWTYWYRCSCWGSYVFRWAKYCPECWRKIKRID